MPVCGFPYTLFSKSVVDDVANFNANGDDAIDCRVLYAFDKETDFISVMYLDPLSCDHPLFLRRYYVFRYYQKWHRKTIILNDKTILITIKCKQSTIF